MNITYELVAKWLGHYSNACLADYYNAIVATSTSDKSKIIVNEIGAGTSPECSFITVYNTRQDNVKVLLASGNHGTRHGILNLGSKIVLSYGLHPATSYGTITCVPTLYVYDALRDKLDIYIDTPLDCTRGNIYSLVYDIVRNKLIASTGIGYFGMHIIDLDEEMNPLPIAWKTIPSIGSYFGAPTVFAMRGIISSNIVLRDGRVLRTISTTPFYGPAIQTNIGFYAGFFNDIKLIYDLEYDTVGEIVYQNDPHIKMIEIPHYLREYDKIVYSLVEIGNDGSWSTRVVVADENLRTTKTIEGYMHGTVTLYGRYVTLSKVIGVNRIDTTLYRFDPIVEDKLYLYDVVEDKLIATNIPATYLPANRILAEATSRNISSFDTNYYAVLSQEDTKHYIELYRILLGGVDYALETVSVEKVSRYRMLVRVRVFDAKTGENLSGVRVNISIPLALNSKNIPGNTLSEKNVYTGSDGVAEAELDIDPSMKRILWNAYVVL